MSKFSIVKLRDHPDAVAPVVRWIHEEWGIVNGRSLDETTDRFQVELDHREKLPHTFVALEDGKPVGVASLRKRDITDWDPGTTPWICNVFVVPQARGKGLASKLCEALEHQAVQQGYLETFLATTVRENSLYHKLGYAQYKLYTGEEYPLYLLRRELNED